MGRQRDRVVKPGARAGSTARASWLRCAAITVDTLSRLDLAFCVDLTGSMGGFIQAAREHMVSILDALRAPLGDGLRVAIVGYRDHCDAKTCEVHPFERDPRAVKATLDGLAVMGGGDYPEAVFTGLSSCLDLPWRTGAYRVVVLVGDAPPHACGAAGDTHARRDPSGLDLDEMANRLEEAGVFVHALAMTAPGRADVEPVLDRAFRRLSISTGGQFHDARGAAAAMEIVDTIGRRFLADIAFDRRLFEVLERAADADVEAIAKALRTTAPEVNAGMMRLRQRKLIGA